MRDIAYQAPRTVDEAVALLNGAKGAAKVLAGGTDLLVQLRESTRHADLIVDVKRIGELTEIRQNTSKGWFIGASVRCAVIEQHPEIVRGYPGLADAVHIIGGWQIKQRASLGGNLCTSSPAADSLPALIALSAEVEIAGPHGRRRVAVEDFCTGPGKNILEPQEIVVGFHLPPATDRSSSCYIRFIPRYEMDIAVVGVGVSLEVEGEVVRKARIALGAVAPIPLLAKDAGDWLAGKSASSESFAQAGELARASARPISDMRAPADYRRHLVGVLVARSLSMANRRVRGETVDSLHDGHF